MSKYHELRTAMDDGDWTTAEGAATRLRDRMKIEGYGIDFQIWRGGLPLNETAASRLIIGKVTTRPVADMYLAGIQDMVRQGRDDLIDGTVATRIKGTRLMFEHGDFKYPVNFTYSNPELTVVIGQKDVARRLKRRNKGDIKREDRSNRLQDKLDDTRETNGANYLAHAGQSGYLMRNTFIRFFAQIEGQYGTSTETQIRGITLPEMQGFIDSAGRETLADVSTHVDTNLEKDGAKIQATHSDFAKEIVDFLNLEYEVDVDSIKRQHREERTDSGFQTIEHWIKYQGGDKGMALKKLLDRRPSAVTPDDITEAFEAGYTASKPPLSLETNDGTAEA